MRVYIKKRNSDVSAIGEYNFESGEMIVKRERLFLKGSPLMVSSEVLHLSSSIVRLIVKEEEHKKI